MSRKIFFNFMKNNNNIKYYSFSKIEEARNKPYFKCPFCHSGNGTHKNSTGALYHYPKTEKEEEHYHCFSCGVTIYNSNSTNSSNRSISTIREDNTDITNGISEVITYANFDYLKERAFHLSYEKKIDWLKNKLFRNRSYSDETISYIANREDYFFINDTQLKKSCLLIPSYDLLRNIAGYQKLFFNKEKNNSDKRNVKDSHMLYNFVINHNSNITFIVESMTNAYAIYCCGYSAICIFSTSNAARAVKELTRSGLYQNLVLFFDKDTTEEKGSKPALSIELAKRYNLQYVDFNLFDDLAYTKQNYDASDFLRDSPERMKAILGIYEPKLEEKKEDKDIFSLLDINKINIIHAPTGAGKTHALIRNMDGKSAIFSYSIKNANAIATEANCNVVTSAKPRIITKENLSSTQKRLTLSLTCKEFAYSTFEDLKQYTSLSIDEYDILLEPKEQKLLQPYHKKEIDQSKEIYTYSSGYHPIYSNPKFIQAIENNEDISLFIFESLISENNEEYCSFGFLNVKEVLSDKKSIYIDREYTIQELVSVCTYEQKDTKQNFHYHKLACLSLSKMMLNCFEEIKEKCKVLLGFKNNDIYLAIMFYYMQHAYIKIALPEIETESGRKALSYEQFLHLGDYSRLVIPNNNAVYFQPTLVFIDYFPLVKCLQIVKENPFCSLNLLTATPPPFLTELKRDLSSVFNSEDISIHNLKNNRELNDIVSVFILDRELKKNEELDLLCEFEQSGFNTLCVKNTKEDARNLFESQKNSHFWLITDDFTNDGIEIKIHDRDNIEREMKGCIVHFRSTIARGANDYANFDILVLDVSCFSPCFADATPWKSMDETQREQIQTRITQYIARFFRIALENKYKAILLHKAKELPFNLEFLKDITAKYTVYHENAVATPGNNAKELMNNILHALKGEPIELYKHAIKEPKAKPKKTAQEKQVEKYKKWLDRLICFCEDERILNDKEYSWHDLYRKFNLHRIAFNNTLYEELKEKNLIKTD